MRQFNCKFTYTENNGTDKGNVQNGSVAVQANDFADAAAAAVAAINENRGGGKITSLTIEDTGEEVSDKPKVRVSEQVKAQHDASVNRGPSDIGREIDKAHNPNENPRTAPLSGKPSGKPDGQ